MLSTMPTAMLTAIPSAIPNAMPSAMLSSAQQSSAIRLYVCNRLKTKMRQKRFLELPPGYARQLKIRHGFV